jgi:radical SAM protein with 4Fe4S-binding SPASM domain
MKEGRAIGFRWLQITGGEPTVHPDLMRLLREAAAIGFEEIALFTNFFALGEDVFTFLREAEMEIHTTIFSHQAAIHDAITGLPGSFERVVAGVRRAREAGLEVLVSIVFMDRNDQDRAATLDFVRGLGVPNDRLKVSYVRPQGRGLELPESTRPPLWDRRMEDWTVEGGEIVATTCWAGKTAIGATGDVYVCVGERTVLGNVATASLRPILKRPAMRKLWKITLDDVPGCSVCEFRYACFDCRADAHLVSNDLLGRDPTCPYDPLTGTWLFKGEPLSMQESNRPKRKENLIVEEMDGDLILADFQTSQMHVLNPIAAAVWDMCDGRQTVDDMVRLLAEHFQVESAQVRPDVERMLEEFRSKGLLE